jgi:signal transduction histidine kinase
MPPASLDLVVPLVAIGVHVTTGVVLVALDAGNPRVRRYLAFLALLTLWLVTLAMRVAGVGGGTVRLVNGAASHLLPLAYLLFAIAVWSGERPRRGLMIAIALAGLALLPLGLTRGPWRPWVFVGYHAPLWVAAAALLVRARETFTDQRAVSVRGRRRVSALLTGVVLVNAAVLVYDAALAATVVIPIVASVAQLAVLVGAQRYQLYGAARRAERAGAERTGALAGDAAELERLALLGELGAVVAHEVRNPLTGIRSLAQRLATGESDDAERRARFASIIVGEVDRLDRFVGSMLALARREAPPAERAETLGVARLFEDLGALVAARAARRGVRVAARVEVPELRAARGPVAQVLVNLLLNAIDASPDGGTVTLASRPAGGGVALVVRDEGAGVPAPVRAHLFEPFAAGALGTGWGSRSRGGWRSRTGGR